MASNGPVTPEEEAIRNLPNIFPFESIGHGYCPVTETVKIKPVLVDPEELKPAFIRGRYFLIPTYLTATDRSTGYTFRRVTFENQELYQRNMAAEYGLGGINLVVNATSEGRWVNGQGEYAYQAQAIYHHETHFSTVRIENPSEHLNSEFRARLEGLPNTFSRLKNQCFRFHDFFTNYGTHLIVQQNLGGQISYSCKLNVTNFNESWARSFSIRMSGMFELIVNGRLGGEFSNAGNTTRSAEVIEERFFMHGGRGQPTDPITELTAQIYRDWKSTIPDNMIELRHGFTLVPYYELLPPISTRAAAMKEATLMFLENRLLSREEYRRRLQEEIMRNGVNVERERNGGEIDWGKVAKVIGGLGLAAAIITHYLK